jgi:hypothetical protein
VDADERCVKLVLSLFWFVFCLFVCVSDKRCLKLLLSLLLFLVLDLFILF